MRYIALKDHNPDQAWLDEANKLLDQLKAAPDEKTRHKIIDDNSRFWGRFKPWLLSLSHDKCWISEVREDFNHYEVEHYRPKTSVMDEDGTKHEGYWWLAFDWKNFRICGNVGNRMKGTFFPLRDGCPRVKPDGDVREEAPLLLDPTDPDDPNLLSFNMEGDAIPAPDLTSDWDRRRVDYSVHRYKLDFPKLAAQRKKHWNDCWNHIQEYRNELTLYSSSDGRNQIARQLAKEKAKAIRKMIHPQEELSAVAKACILSTGDSRIIGMLQSD